ncbi:hypothetical protein OCU04_000310 [Sclerotinia nivalis]|uniref:Uncharacterized protein n=1 Tax=Sclerotinia nivalis TaxID=352851 RepID=A0A9X0DNA6_9HELO|nr:hypothetical protein OCU04_000310 [Sclerotinia nivalis]
MAVDSDPDSNSGYALVPASISFSPCTNTHPEASSDAETESESAFSSTTDASGPEFAHS